MIRHSAQLTVFVLIAGAALAGCSSTTSGSGAHTSLAPTVSSSVSAPSTSAAPTQTASASGRATSTRVTTPQCTNDIRVIPGTSQGAAGHLAQVLVFNNISTTTTCEIIGYPGVDLVTSSGATVVHLTRTLRGMAGGEPTGVTAPQAVVLPPGASASALAEASDVPQGGIANCGSYSLLVTVPNQFVAVPGGTSMLPRCAAEIHPVVPGTSGGKH
jgi:predicted small secreted protein